MARTTFSAQSKNIGELLGGNDPSKLVVPEFQRGYSWEKKHVAAFWKDIIDLQKDGTRENHFLGPMVTLPKSKNVTELLDGQQRLATATILFSVLRDVARDLGDKDSLDFARDIQNQFILKEGTSGYALDMGETDNLYFRDSIQSFPSGKKKPTLRSHNKIHSARILLTESVKAHLGPVAPGPALTLLVCLKRTLRSHLVMTVIPVTSDQDAFWIFETLNDRGLRLSVPDLLLNYLMRVAIPKTDRTQIRQLWNEMLERMGKRDITRFLRHLWVSKYGDLKDQDLFSALRKHIDEKRIKSLDFARTCSDDCESYVQLLDGKTEHLGKAAPYVQRLLRVLDFQPALPLLLSSYQTLTIPDFETVSKWMLVFVTRYAIVSDLDPSGLETIFFELARQIRDTKRNAKDIRGCLANVKDALMKKAPADEQVKVAVAKLVLSPDEANYVLSRLANRMQTGTREIALDETNLEHIFPKKPKKNEWGGEANHATLEPYLWHIGNLTMLGERLNAGAGNEEYKIKRESYGKRSELRMAQEVAKDYPSPTWNKATIEDRAKKLAPYVVEVWNFNNASRV